MILQKSFFAAQETLFIINVEKSCNSVMETLIFVGVLIKFTKTNSTIILKYFTLYK